MGDAVARLHDGFVEDLGALLGRHENAVSGLTFDEARLLGAQSAEAALAPLIWAAIGERWSTGTVAELLDVTRQALHKRVVKGTALGVPGRGTTWFPVWQLDLDAHQVRSGVTEIIAAFHDELGAVDPLMIASWAATAQPELRMSPEEWLAAGRDPTEVTRMGQRTASELGR